MGRAKVAMEPITDNKKRNITFRNRKEGIIKKARELTTLCDVNISMIICTDDQEPEIFPPDARKLNTLINRYKRNQITEPGNICSYSLSDFFKDRKIKIEEELAKVKKKNLAAKYPTWFDFLNNFSEGHLRGFASGLGSKIHQVKTKIETLKKISKVQNLDRYPFHPNAVLDVQSSFITPSLNANPMMATIPLDHNNLGFDLAPLNGDQNNSFVKSLNPDSAYFDSFEKWLMSDDDNDCYDYKNFNLQPPSFPLQILQQPVSSIPPYFSDMPSIVSDFKL